jgi:hypothetical protein
MMEAADHRRLDDPAFVRALHRSWLRGVLRQGEVGAGPVVRPMRMRGIMPAIIDQAGPKSTSTRWTE